MQFIKQLWPVVSPVSGGTYISIITRSLLHPPVFCRFNESVVSGRVTTNGTIVCLSPAFAEGIVGVAVSTDKATWIGAAQVRYVNFDRYSARMFGIFLICLAVLVPCVVIERSVKVFRLRRYKSRKSDGPRRDSGTL
jgi:hypothetical protein